MTHRHSTFPLALEVAQFSDEADGVSHRVYLQDRRCRQWGCIHRRPHNNTIAPLWSSATQVADETQLVLAMNTSSSRPPAQAAARYP
mmetsp:Transcript_101846/g.197064  ORF Transcript_101846/g.197064 Transcript_101846/m.197064 type:complete len:87 (+) Transcript_101846:968-1228(+)